MVAVLYVEEFKENIRNALQTVFATDLGEYGCGSQLYSGVSGCKQQSFFLEGVNYRTGIEFYETVGTEFESTSLESKLAILEKNRDFVTSVQYCDPSRYVCAVALRSSVDPTFFVGGAGLPAVVGNILLASCMLKHNLLVESDYCTAVYHRHMYVQRMFYRAGMTRDQYKGLQDFIQSLFFL